MAPLAYSNDAVDDLQRSLNRLRDQLTTEFNAMETQVEQHIGGWSHASVSRQAQIRQRTEMRQRFDQLMEALNQATQAFERVREAGQAAESRCVVLMSE